LKKGGKGSKTKGGKGKTKDTKGSKGSKGKTKDAAGKGGEMQGAEGEEGALVVSQYDNMIHRVVMCCVILCHRSEQFNSLKFAQHVH
jgi:hypothetical protein